MLLSRTQVIICVMHCMVEKCDMVHLIDWKESHERTAPTIADFS
jgi:hypothetical protein